MLDEPDNVACERVQVDDNPCIELSLEELVPFAMKMHQENRLDAAEKCYHTALKRDSKNI